MSVRWSAASIAWGARAALVAVTATIGCAPNGLAAEFAAGGGGSGMIGPPGSGTTTLPAALIQAYRNNPQLNAQRAATRATDENVPTALSGYRPRVIGTGSLTEQYIDTTTRSPPLGTTTTSPPTALPAFPTYTRNNGNVAVSSAGVTVTQTLFNGFQTANRTRQAEGQVFSAARDLAHHRADRPAQCRHRLYEFAADRGPARAPAQQRERARSDVAADARSLQRRRGHPHRRRPGRVAASPPAARSWRSPNRTTSPPRRSTCR